MKLYILVALLVALAMALVAGCGGDSKKATGPVIMAVIPGCEGFTLNHYANRFFGPTGKYSLALVAGVGKVVATTVVVGRGDPTAPQVVKYGFGVAQVESEGAADPGGFIRSILPDSAGLYDLSPQGYYKLTAYNVGELDAIPVADCVLQTEADFDAPGFHIESSPAIAGPWKQIWATDGVATVPTGTYIKVIVNSGVINTLNTLTVNNSVTGKNTAYTEGTSVTWPAGDNRFNVVVAKNGRDYVLTLVLRVTP